MSIWIVNMQYENQYCQSITMLNQIQVRCWFEFKMRGDSDRTIIRYCTSTGSADWSRAAQWKILIHMNWVSQLIPLIDIIGWLVLYPASQWKRISSLGWFPEDSGSSSIRISISIWINEWIHIVIPRHWHQYRYWYWQSDLYWQKILSQYWHVNIDASILLWRRLLGTSFLHEGMFAKHVLEGRRPI